MENEQQSSSTSAFVRWWKGQMLDSPARGASLTMILLVAAVMVVAATFIRDPYYQLVLSTVPIWASLALSWNLFSGYTGLISFGHATFFGLGAFAVALLNIKLGVTPWIGLLVAAGVGGLAALLIGMVTFRLRGHYFALAMLAYPSLFIFLFDWMGWQELTFPIRRENGVWHMQFEDPRVYTLLGVILMTGMLLLTLLVERSRFGLAMLSIKQNETAAEAAGVNTVRIKMTGFIVSGALGALVGGFHALVLQVVTPSGVFGTVVSAQALILTLFGGVGTLWGPVIGAVVLVPLTEALRAHLGHILPGIQGVIYGLTIMLVILLAPEGVYWRVKDLFTQQRPQKNRELQPAQQAHQVTPEPSGWESRTDATPLLQVRGLSRSFGGLKAVSDVGFDVVRGEILGIIGPNGAGKTTLFNLLNGIIPPSAGQICLDGKDVTGARPSHLCRLGLARTFQVARPFPRMNVLKNVVVGAISATEDAAQAQQRAHEALCRVGLQNRALAQVDTLTNLELRLLELARALASGPRLVLLDETLAGLGSGEVEDMLRVIQQLPTFGVTVVIIEHTMHAMTRLADRFLVLDHGRLIAQGEPTEVMHVPEVVNAYLGRKWARLHAAA